MSTMSSILSPSKSKRTENLYRTMHNSHKGYRTFNQGIRRAVHWMQLLREAPAAILEVGCGNGLLCEMLVGGGYDVTGLDVVPGPYNREGYHFVKHNMATGPLPFSGKLAGRFDYCLSFDFLEHLPQKWVASAIYEMSRVADEIIGTVACFPQARLHLTVHEPEWWRELFGRVCSDRKMYYKVFENDAGKTILYYSKGNSL